MHWLSNHLLMSSVHWYSRLLYETQLTIKLNEPSPFQCHKLTELIMKFISNNLDKMPHCGIIPIFSLCCYTVSSVGSCWRYSMTLSGCRGLSCETGKDSNLLHLACRYEVWDDFQRVRAEIIPTTALLQYEAGRNDMNLL